MAGATKIEWATRVWNPIVGCSLESPGCTLCYAMRDAWRKNSNPRTPHYHGLTKKVNGKPVWTGAIAHAPERVLHQPLSWRAPERVFVNSMGDLFHPSIAADDIARVFAIMACAPRHIFKVLTKRDERMADLVATARFRDDVLHSAVEIARGRGIPLPRIAGGWPLSNVWLGVSVEDNVRRHRLDRLRRTPAALRFVSFEPLLGHLDFSGIDGFSDNDGFSGISWIIIGGESGPGARRMELAWARSLARQAQRAGVPVFVKQLGAHATTLGVPVPLAHPKGGDPAEWPLDLRVQQLPQPASGGTT